MGFHCGNTPACHLVKPEMKYQLIMKRSLEPDSEPDITRGTLEGDIRPGDITFFRLQGAADCSLHSYVAVSYTHLDVYKRQVNNVARDFQTGIANSIENNPAKFTAT